MLLLSRLDLWIIATEQFLVVVRIEVECSHIIGESAFSCLNIVQPVFRKVLSRLERFLEAEIDLVPEIEVALSTARQA